ncbi:MAG: protein kinase [Acidobacteriota bacterium]|nr:MAG: protein kinase [Acidobacteriota bacterium]
MRELSLDNCRIDKRYDIVRRLGTGSYSEVFLATDNFAAEGSPRRNVVIKALNTALRDDADADLERTLVENFQYEALSLDKVRHPNIVNRLGHGTARDLSGRVFHYIILEYMPGGDLQSVLRNGPIDFQKAVSYIEQICSGLGHAHDRGVIHRDIKPHNLLLSGDRHTVKITDFGVARGILSDGPITRVGSNVYAPPEHSPFVSASVGKEVKIGPSSDIYSLAKTAYAMLTGEIPRRFTGSPIVAMQETGVQSISPGLLAVIEKATQDDPRSRYSSVAEFWTNFSSVVRNIEDDETETVVSRRYAAPQPHVARGYSPIPPHVPTFTDDLTFKHGGVPSKKEQINDLLRNAGQPAGQVIANDPVRKRKRGFVSAVRFLAATIILATIAGGIYGTASWLGSLNFIPDVVRPYISSTAVASSDVYLRSTPGTDNQPLGIVTKKSKLRVIKVQDNWYHVDILEQGRKSTGAPDQGRGWVNGKYLEL